MKPKDFEQLAKNVVLGCSSWQNSMELAKLLELAHGLEPKGKPKTLVEIGFGHGATFLAFSMVLPDNSKLVSISWRDLVSAKAVRFLLERPLLASFFISMRKILPLKKLVKLNNILSLQNKNQQLFFIDGDSTEERTVGMLNALLGVGKIDFLFIDGNHKEELVRKDFDNYGKLVRKGGVIAFHDIESEPGVKAVWESIPKNKKKEFNFEGEKRALGLGIVFKS